MSKNDALLLNRIKGFGATPTLCLPGFVPKSGAAFHNQIDLFKEFGDVWLVDYPNHGFNLKQVLTHLSETICLISRESGPPVIVSVSFGSALVMQLLQRKPLLPLEGCVFVSPMASLKDIFLEERDATFFGKVAGSVVSADKCKQPAGELQKCIEGRVAKARKVFRRLLLAGYSRTAPDVPQPVVEQILRDLLLVEDAAVLERLKAIAEIPDLCGRTTLTTAPTLILWAEEEHEVIRKESCNFKLLCRQPGKLFPEGRSIKLSSGNPESRLKHASLLAHSNHYNREIEQFYIDRLTAGERPA